MAIFHQIMVFLWFYAPHSGLVLRLLEEHAASALIVTELVRLDAEMQTKIFCQFQ